jgi:hypothetical protein
LLLALAAVKVPLTPPPQLVRSFKRNTRGKRLADGDNDREDVAGGEWSGDDEGALADDDQEKSTNHLGVWPLLVAKHQRGKEAILGFLIGCFVDIPSCSAEGDVGAYSGSRVGGCRPLQPDVLVSDPVLVLKVFKAYFRPLSKEASALGSTSGVEGSATATKVGGLMGPLLLPAWGAAMIPLLEYAYPTVPSEASSSETSKASSSSSSSSSSSASSAAVQATMLTGKDVENVRKWSALLLANAVVQVSKRYPIIKVTYLFMYFL